MISGTMPYQKFEDMMRTLEIQIRPMPKPRMTNRDRFGWRQSPAATRYFVWKDQLTIMLKESGHWEKIQEICYLSCDFVIPMPKSWTRGKRAQMDGKRHSRTPDLSNLVKALEDAVFDNDAHISHYCNVRKLWGKEGKIILRFLDGSDQNGKIIAVSYTHLTLPTTPYV